MLLYRCGMLHYYVRIFLRICNKTIMYQNYILNSGYYLCQPLVDINKRQMKTRPCIG